jgi:hypothetical protein
MKWIVLLASIVVLFVLFGVFYLDVEVTTAPYLANPVPTSAIHTLISVVPITLGMMGFSGLIVWVVYGGNVRFTFGKMIVYGMIVFLVMMTFEAAFKAKTKPVLVHAINGVVEIHPSDQFTMMVPSPAQVNNGWAPLPLRIVSVTEPSNRIDAFGPETSAPLPKGWKHPQLYIVPLSTLPADLYRFENTHEDNWFTIQGIPFVELSPLRTSAFLKMLGWVLLGYIGICSSLMGILFPKIDVHEAPTIH